MTNMICTNNNYTFQYTDLRQLAPLNGFVQEPGLRFYIFEPQNKNSDTFYKNLLTVFNNLSTNNHDANLYFSIINRILLSFISLIN